MCPQKVCQECGEPSRRITEATEDYAKHLGSSWADKGDGRTKASGTERNSHSGQPVGDHLVAASRATVGWTDCGHGSYRTGVVLDPFAGSGTTLAVATGHGRDAIGVDLDRRNAQLARERVGMFLTVEGDEVPVSVEPVQDSVMCAVAGHAHDDEIEVGMCLAVEHPREAVCPNCDHPGHHAIRCADTADEGTNPCACSWPDSDNYADPERHDPREVA